MKQRARSNNVLTITALITIAAGSSALSADPQMLGFNSERAAEQRQLEQRFDSQLDAGQLNAWLKQLSSAPNNVGSPHDKANAEFILQQFKSWGWDAHIEAFDVLYPTLKSHRLEMLAPSHFVASLREPSIAGDATSKRTDGVPQFNAYGGDGDVTGELVYVNYGMPDDYKELARLGIDVKGKIVMTRYGGGWRGLKPKLAQEHGALACIIYSDPHEDGYFVGDAYPNGGWRPAGGAQRGSVLDMPVRAGDPLTPDVGATKDAKRLSLADAKTILTIPVLPISYSDAQPLLSALTGPVAPIAWRGALPMTYHVGPAARIHLAVTSNWNLHTIYDVIAKVPGSEFPDEWVVRGNHFDAWVFGASDPLSGTIALLAEAKAIGALLKSGWKPKRTLVYATWDGEEPGLLGSTEWSEMHAQELQRKTVVYINSDSNGRGFLAAGGSHSLQRLINEVAQSVKDPETNVTVRERLKARMLVRGYERGANEQQKAVAKKAAEGGDLPIAALGSGSDYSPFLQHLGLASLNVSYDGEDEESGSYHSNYDSFDHYSKFGDPTFAYGVAQAQTVGRIVLRIADADIVPMQFGDVSDTFNGYIQELHKLADDKRKNAGELGKLLDQNAFTLASDPTKPVLPPVREPEVPYLDFSALDNAGARLKKSAKAYDEAMSSNASKLTTTQRVELNGLLRGLEQTLVNPQGLPRRDWYKHLIYAPGLLTGYGVKTMPGVREAIDENLWDEANRYAAITAKALKNYCDRLDRATSVLMRER